MRLRVLTLNVWGLPPPVGRDVRERLALVLEELPRHGCDLAIFQEAWTAAARDQLTAGGREFGFAHAWSPEGIGAGGLLALSKRPFEATAFHRYTLCGLPQRLTQMDFYSGKGVARLELNVGGALLSVFTTHLHARYVPTTVTDEYVGHRTAEVIEFAEALRAASGPVLAVGDFNLRESSPEYAALIGLTGLVDAAVALDARQPTVTLQNAYRLERAAIGESRIDYVFSRSGRDLGIAPVSLARVFDEPIEVAGAIGAYSDHAGLLAEVEIGGAGEAQPDIAADTLASCRELLAEGRAEAVRRRTRERLAAAGAGIAGVGAIAVARSGALSRRGFLRGASWGLAVLAGASGASLLALAERFVPTELAGYANVEATLDRLVGGRKSSDLARREQSVAALGSLR